jgi:hypothetical protein
LEDKALIPINVDNFDYIQYLKWLSEGNTPEPEFTEQELANNVIEFNNSNAKAALIELDKASVRAMREFLLAKFDKDPALPKILSDIEAAAIKERDKIK